MIKFPLWWPLTRCTVLPLHVFEKYVPFVSSTCLPYLKLKYLSIVPPIDLSIYLSIYLHVIVIYLVSVYY